MKEQTILKTAFIISVLGIMLLYLFADALVIPETNLNETDGKDGKTLKIVGNVKNIYIKNSTNEDRINKTYTILTIEQLNTINVYVDQDVNLIKDTIIEITGKKEGSLLFAEEIKVIRKPP